MTRLLCLETIDINAFSNSTNYVILAIACSHVVKENAETFFDRGPLLLLHIYVHTHTDMRVCISLWQLCINLLN